MGVFSKATFGIYLFHNGALLPIIEDFIGLNSDVYLSCNWIPLLLRSAVLIFLSGALIDVVREKTIEKLWIRIYERPIHYIDNKMNDFIDDNS